MKTNTIYMIQGSKEKSTKTTFFQYLGYSLGSNPCFHIWSYDNTERTLFSPSVNWIEKNLLASNELNPAQKQALETIATLQENIKRLSDTIKSGFFQASYIKNCRATMKGYNETINNLKTSYIL